MEIQQAIEQLQDLRMYVANAKAEAINEAISALQHQHQCGECKEWNDVDCDTCPIRTWEACDEICVSKATMAEKIEILANDIDIKLDALLKAEDDRDHWKARVSEWESANEHIARQNDYLRAALEAQTVEHQASIARVEALERAIKEHSDSPLWDQSCVSCSTCVHTGKSECKNCGDDYRPWEFDQAKFSGER